MTVATGNRSDMPGTPDVPTDPRPMEAAYGREAHTGKAHDRRMHPTHPTHPTNERSHETHQGD